MRVLLAALTLFLLAHVVAVANDLTPGVNFGPHPAAHANADVSWLAW